MPGPRDPWLTPYTIAFGRALAERRHRRVVLVAAGQIAKTDTLLDVIGRQFDQAPVPILYVGPNKQFLTEQFEPRLMALFDEAPRLRGKVARGKRMTKTRKVVAGVPIRLAHAGSPTALKSDPASLALTDEADDLIRNVKGQGDPIALVDVRGSTYADFVHGIVSTPSEGPSQVERDEASGLEFWKAQDEADLGSKIWSLWQQGTRHHWAWPCPHCGDYFIARFSLLRWPKDATPAEARRAAHLACPNCGGVIEEGHKQAMNARGVYVAPGQKVSRRGKVTGEAPDSSTLSFWVSGLASPFVSFGQRAEAFLQAVASGDQESVRGVINGGFGELYAPGGGEAPEWMEVARRKLPYARGTVPDGVLLLTAGVDIQKDRLVYVIRGWGLRQESWLIDHGEIWGDPVNDQIWVDLAHVLEAEHGGFHVRRAFIDSGFRPGKAEAVPDHRVYEFCRRHARLAFATKGFDRRPAPLTVNRIDVTPKGGRSKYGLDLVRLDSDFFKSWVHQRVRWPDDQPGGWHLHQDVDEDYCRQIVSEARMRKPSGGVQWVSRSRDNHYLDAEALSYAAAYMLGVQRLTDQHVARRRPRPGAVGERATAAPRPEEQGSPAPGGATPRRRGRRVIISGYL